MFMKRKYVNKQPDKACKQDIDRILLFGLNWIFDSDSLGFESFGFGFLNFLSLGKTLSNLLCDHMSGG